jgi:hypothetical protein
MYIIGISVSFFTFAFTGTQLDYVGILSQGAILATFGSALITVSDIFERDRLERVKLNNKILYDDIKHIKQWTRWPFLPRKASEKLLDDNSINIDLQNPKEEFDVGTHKIKVILPTVLEDFFDLPIFKDFRTMRQYESAFKTKYNRDIKEKGSNITIHNSYFKYMCVYDILRSACIFRLARILKHFSIALIIGSVLITAICINKPAVVGCLKTNVVTKNVKKVESPKNQVKPTSENDKSSK